MIGVAFIAEIILPPLLAWLLGRYRPLWSRWRMALLSALPIPLILWGLCIYLFVSASITPAEECGIDDACSMSITAIMVLAVVAFGLLLLGSFLGFFVVRRNVRPVEPNLADIFE